MSAANAAASTAGIAAIVVSHDSAETLEECLSRLRAAQDVAEIRVVDNDSRAPSGEHEEASIVHVFTKAS